jgi:hypothetical protein
MTESDTPDPTPRTNTHPADLPARGGPAAALSDEDRRMAKIGVGCFTTFIGGISGAMVGVLLSVGVTFGTRCKPIEGLPSCDWHIFAGWGALVGAITLPILALSRLRRRERAGT